MCAFFFCTTFVGNLVKSIIVVYFKGEFECGNEIENDITPLNNDQQIPLKNFSLIGHKDLSF